MPYIYLFQATDFDFEGVDVGDTAYGAPDEARTGADLNDDGNVAGGGGNLNSEITTATDNVTTASSLNAVRIEIYDNDNLGGSANTGAGGADLNDPDNQDELFNERVGDEPEIQKITADTGTFTINGVTYDPDAGNGLWIHPDYTLTIEDPDGNEVDLYGISIVSEGTNNGGGDQDIVGFVTSGPILPNTTYTITNNGNYNSDEQTYADFFYCFCTGVLIETPEGYRMVETLGIGDQVVTRDHGNQKIRWIGKSTVSGNRPATAPIVIAENALGNSEKLTVSPNHRILVSGWRSELLFGEPEVLVAAKDLVNGDTITTAQSDTVDYYHILLERHELLHSNGIWSESFFLGPYAMETLSPSVRRELEEAVPEAFADASFPNAPASNFARSAIPSLKSREGRLL